MKNKIIFKLEDENNLLSVIKHINNLKMKKEIILENFQVLNRLFSFFYLKKVYIKKTFDVKKYVYYKQHFEKINFEKVEEMLKILEDMEIKEEYFFETVEGESILQKLIAKYYLSKRFFTHPKFVKRYSPSK